MREKILLLNPTIQANKDLPNLAVAYAATILNARVIDFNIRPTFKERLLENEAEVLAISIQSRALAEAQRIKNFYQSNFPRCQIKSLSTPIDIQCCYPFVDWKERLIVEAEFSDNLPFPNYELFDSFEILYNNWQKGKWAYPIMTSLGCPYQCVYCMASNRKWRARSVDNCIEELKQAKDKWGIKSFQIIDDNFSIDKARILDFCRKVKPLQMKWFCLNGLRADLFDEDIAKVISDAGCQQISFGVETANPELLLKIKKGETLQEIEKAVLIAKKYFNMVNLYFIIGLPGSSYQQDLYNLHWAIKKGVKAHFSYYVPFEGSPTKDGLFFGQGAKPIGGAYSKDLQERIYKMAGYMRGEYGHFGRAKNVLRAFLLISVFDFNNFPKHFGNFLNILLARI